MNKDVIYLLLIFALLVIPRAIQRFSIPAPLTCLAFGIGAVLWLDDGAHDPVVSLLSILGISSLFLFAGLEVDIASLRKGLWPLLAHLLIRSASLVGVAWLAWRYAGLSWQAAGLLALALLTPSTGFIMDSLSQLGLGDEERFWVTSKAIAGELLALAAMFVVMQADDPVHLGLSSLALVAMMVGLPLLFVGLGRWVAPHAPGSEFSLLVMVACSRPTSPTGWGCTTWSARSLPGWWHACCNSGCRRWPRTRTCTRCACSPRSSYRSTSSIPAPMCPATRSVSKRWDWEWSSPWWCCRCASRW